MAVTDGSPATAWTAESPRATLTLDLGQPHPLGRITVERGSHDPFFYLVQTSPDSTTWTTLATTLNSSSPTNTDAFDAHALPARYLRLQFPGAGDAHPSIAEITIQSPN